MKQKIERTFLEEAKRFLGPFWGNKKVTLSGIVFYSIWAIGPIMHIYFVEKIVRFIELKDLESFINTMIWYSGVLVFYYFLTYISRKWWWVITANAYRKVIHREYLMKFIKLSNTETEKIWTGKLISIMWTGMDVWCLLLDKLLNNALKIIFTIVFTFYMISIVNLWSWIIFIIFYVLVHAIWEHFNQKSLIHRRRRQNVWNEYTGNLVRLIMSKFEILQTWKIDTELNKIDSVSDGLVKHNLAMANPTHWFYYTPSIFINIVKMLMFSFLGYQVILWNASISLFVVLFGALTLMNNVIISSMQFYSGFTNDFTKIEKLWDLFDSTPKIEWYDRWKEFIHSRWDIEVKDLSYAYSEGDNVFTDFSLKIPGEQVTAIVWVSGWGKSTLVKLISWYIRADSGEIIIDGQKLSEVSLKSYYKDIGYLTQEPSVFDGTVIENLTYALTKAPAKKKLDEIIKLAKCEFIYDFPNWLETEIWEKWIRLSWGQRQRLAIAKIFLKDPKIIILDEPTSALDSFSEEQITIAMHNLFKWRTVIIIAHRLQTVKSAADIILIEDGQVKERWTHSELVKKKWVYKKMLDLQSWF